MHRCFGIQLFLPLELKWLGCMWIIKKVAAKQIYLCLLGEKRILQFSRPRVKRNMAIQTQGHSKAVTGSQHHQIISDNILPGSGELHLHLQTHSGTDLHHLIPFAEFSSILHTREPSAPRRAHSLRYRGCFSAQLLLHNTWRWKAENQPRSFTSLSKAAMSSLPFSGTKFKFLK